MKESFGFTLESSSALVVVDIRARVRRVKQRPDMLFLWTLFSS